MTLLTSLTPLSFTVPCEYANDRHFAEHTIGDWYISYVVHYRCEIKNYMSATREQPEEGDLQFEVTRISDLAVCYKERDLKLGEVNKNRIGEWLVNKIQG